MGTEWVRDWLKEWAVTSWICQWTRTENILTSSVSTLNMKKGQGIVIHLITCFDVRDGGRRIALVGRRPMDTE